MKLATFIITVEAIGASLAVFTNIVLLLCIRHNTAKTLKPYSRILRQNSLCDMFYSIIILMTFLHAETDKGDYILFLCGIFRDVPQPYNGLLCMLYAFALYFSLFSYAIPFVYRYLMVVKEIKISRLQFYMFYLVTFAIASAITIGIAVNTEWPQRGVNGTGTKFDEGFDDFWRDDQGLAPIFVATPMATAPLFIGGIPVSLILASWFSNIRVPRMGSTGYSGLTFTTFINPCLAIWFIVPYRVAVIDWTRKNVLRQNFVRHDPDKVFGGTTMLANHDSRVQPAN